MLKRVFLTLALSLAVPLLAADVGVRIRFGLTDKMPTKWDGTVSVSPGTVERIDGWRFQDGDEVQGTTGWKASSRALSVRRANNPKKAPKARGGAGNMADNGVLLLLTEVSDASVVKVATAKGNFD